MDLSPSIRAATPSDLPRITAAFRDHAFLAACLDHQQVDGGLLLVAWRGARPVGNVYLRWTPAGDQRVIERMPTTPMLQHLEVEPAEQGRGVGTALLRAAERAVHERGHGMVLLLVGVGNPRAQRLYQRLGYVDWEFGTVIDRWREPDGRGGWRERSDTCHVLIKTVTPGVPGLDAWDAWRPAQAAKVLAGCPVPWYVAGGWALDLHHGRQTRAHSDLEIAIPRVEFANFRRYLRGFALYDAGGGRVRPLGPEDEPDPANHQIWVCDPAVPAWRMDTFLEPGDSEVWISRRDERICVPYPEVVAHTPEGVPYLRPEWVLFTKAAHAREKDEDDLIRALPTLGDAARTRLAEEVTLSYPGHRWLDLIDL